MEDDELNFYVHGEGKSAHLSYPRFIMLGEFLRNCCVNIELDPDMVDGKILNISVLQEGEDIQSKNTPDTAIGDVFGEGQEEIEIEFVLKS